MCNTLFERKIILPSGEINKNKINLVAGAITQPFAELLWITTNGDMDTINRLTLLLLEMNNPQDRSRLFQLIQILYALLGLQFSDEALQMGSDPDVLDYFLFSFLDDLGEGIIQIKMN